MQADLNLRLGRSHMALRNSKEGAKHLDAALEYYQKFDGQYAKEQGEAHLLRAHARINLGRYDEAGLDIDRLIWLQPKNAESYALRAIVRAKKKDYADAFADVDIALEMQPSLSTAYQARAAVRYEMLYAPAAEVGLNNNSALMNALRTNGIDIQNEKNAAMYALFTKKELDEIMLFDNNLGAYRLGRENNNIRLDALAANDELDRLYKTQKKKDNGNTFYTSILLDYEKALQLDYNNQDARTGLENMRRFAPITGLDPELMGNEKAIAGVETIPASQKTQPIRVMAAYWPSIRNTEDIIENMRGRITFEDRALRTYEYHTDKDLTNQDWAEIAQKAKDGKKYSYNASERTVALQVGQAFWGQYLTRSIVPWYVPLSVNLYETQGRVAVYDGYGYGPYQIISKPTQESQGMRELNHNIRELGGNSLKVLPEVGKDYGFRSYKTYVPHVYNLFTRMQNYTNHKTTPSTFAPTAKGYEAIRTVAVGYNSADGKEQYGQIVSLTCKYLFTKSQEYNKDALAPPSAPALVAQMHQKLGSPPLEIEMHETEIAEKEVGSKTAAPAPTMTSGQAYAMFEENGKCLGVIIDPKQTRVSILKLKNAKALDGAVAIAQDNAHASKEQAIAVVTPSYYETSKVPTYEVTINETVIANGVKTSPWTLWVGTDGIAHIEQTSDFMLRQPNRTSRPEVAFAIGSKPLKIDNGEKIEARDLTSDGNRDRTLAALTDDGRLIFATFNASKKGGKSNWMTYDKAADMLMEQAEKNGVKIDKMLFLDGGGSTKLWVGGETPKSYEGSEGKESKRRLNFYITVYTNEGQE